MTRSRDSTWGGRKFSNRLFTEGAVMDLYVPGVPGSVNRYFVCSERLRERGWRGVGDYWWTPGGFQGPGTFEHALRVTGIGRFYDWQVTKELTACVWESFRTEMAPRLDALTEAAAKLAEVVESNASLSKAMKGER